VSRTVIDIDDDALAAAQARLGTHTKVQTVNEALRRAATLPSQAAAARTIIALLDTSDIDNREVMEGAWRTVPGPATAKSEP
jgi:Arc/MetJ family transcription regulator